MLKPINRVANAVADGRRYASRSIVISGLSAVACFVFRRQVIPAEVGESREETIWEGGQLLSEHEEHATEYVEQGYAMMLFDHFTGGSIHSDGDDINSGEAMIYAQIEPFYFDNYPNKADMLRNTPDWKPKKGDVFGLVVDDNLIKWLECIGVSGQSAHAQHGERYVLNVRDSLMHLDPFKDHENILLPEANRFPIALNELLYSDAPIYAVNDQGTADMSDDEIRTKLFKLVSFNDQNLAGYMSVIATKHMAKKTNSPYFFSGADEAKITVNIANDEQYILSSDTAVSAIETSLGYFSYLLFVVDRVSVVNKIASDLLLNKAVRLTRENSPAFEILPTHFDEVRKAYHFIIFAQIGVISEYMLEFEDGVKYSLSVDMQAVEVI